MDVVVFFGLTTLFGTGVADDATVGVYSDGLPLARLCRLLVSAGDLGRLAPSNCRN